MSQFKIRKLITTLILGLGITHLPAYSEESPPLKLYKEGKLDKALVAIDEMLARDKQDPQTIMLKGVILAEKGQRSEAKKIFQSLITDYPNIPEPYNNLAVIYAMEGDLAKARVLLESALKTNITYATAYENLGDIYAKLASDSYAKALNLKNNKETTTKLRLIKDVIALTPIAATEMPNAKGSRNTPESLPNDKSGTLDRQTQPEIKPSKTNDTQTNEVTQALEDWRTAWESKNIDEYINKYADSFFPKRFKNRSEWVNDRTAKILPRRSIRIKLENIRYTGTDSETVQTSFTQIYNSDILSSRTTKTLVWKKIDGNWKIIEERTGS